jgi:GR25 family glycosyltransferase involved in LPS biosynthesis
MKNIITYLINLDRDVSRLDSCVQQFSKFNMHFVRIAAVDMYELNENQSTLVTPGVMACWLSHKKVLANFLSTNYDYALIFEDDFKIDSISSVRNAINSDWLSDFDVVQLGYIKPGYQNKIRITLANLEVIFFKFASNLLVALGTSKKLRNRLRIRVASQTPMGWVPASFEPGTHCYLISRSAASSVLELNDPQFLSADDFYSALARMRSFQFLRPYKSFVSQKKFPKFPGPRFIQN